MTENKKQSKKWVWVIWVVLLLLGGGYMVIENFYGSLQTTYGNKNF